MNRTSLSVVAMAVGAVLLLGLFNIYEPQAKALVNKVFHHVHVDNMGLKTRHYAGLSYTDDGSGNIDFTGGRLDLSNTWLRHGIVGPDAPQDLQKAKALKFESSVDVSHASTLWSLFGYDPYVESIDLGSNFDTSLASRSKNSWGGNAMDSMFQDDPNLRYLNLGPKFRTESNDSMFYHDKNLTWNNIVGNKNDGVGVKESFRDAYRDLYHVTPSFN